MKSSRTFLRILGTTALSALCVAGSFACSSDDDEAGTGAGGGGTSDPTEPFFDPTGGSGEGGLNGGGHNGEGGITGSSFGSIFDDACDSDVRASEGTASDIYIMFDMSGSMGWYIDSSDDAPPAEQRITFVREAVTQFLAAPENAGVGVGLGFFGDQPLNDTTCDPDDYATPEVQIGALTDGHRNSLNSALNAVDPTGATPTGAAIRGACSYVTDHPTHVSILLVTDGVPRLADLNGDCPNPSFPTPDIGDAEDAAGECLDQGIQTFVLGVGESTGNLNGIANNGGTDEAYIVGGGGDVTAEVLAALNAIRGRAEIPCEFSVPDAPGGVPLVPSETNVVYTADGVLYEALPWAGADGTNCGNSGDVDGWYYDSETDPSQIFLCEKTCGTVSTAPNAELGIAFSCDERININ